MQNARNYPAIIDAPGSRLVLWQVWFDRLSGSIR